jgi:hypothetical protein
MWKAESPTKHHGQEFGGIEPNRDRIKKKKSLEWLWPRKLKNNSM